MMQLGVDLRKISTMHHAMENAMRDVQRPEDKIGVSSIAIYVARSPSHEVVAFSVKESKNFSTNILSPRLFVVHDTGGGCKNNVTKLHNYNKNDTARVKTDLSGRKKTSGPTFDLLNSDIETGTDDTTFVQSSIELNDNLTRPVVINVLELANLDTVFLHDNEKLDDDLRRRPDHDLPLASLLRIEHTLQSIVKHTDSHHLSKLEHWNQNQKQ
ncbi:hypothetical protein YC2023_123084 [Brassica napus]